MIENTVLLHAGRFGLGWLPFAPGTFGSLLGIPLAWWMLGRTLTTQVIFTVLLLAIGVLICHWASQWLASGDASQIVADEFLAFPIVLLGLSLAPTPWMMMVAFALYRLFDITKLPLIHHTEAVGGGLGIMLDDVLAAVYALIALRIGIELWRWRNTS